MSQTLHAPSPRLPSHTASVAAGALWAQLHDGARLAAAAAPAASVRKPRPPRAAPAGGMAPAPQTTGTAAQRLRRLGLHVTVGRLAVLAVLEQSEAALSGEELHALLVQRKVPSSVGTVYRSIHEFEDRGLVCREGAPGHKARYRLLREGGAGPVLRFVCGKCGLSREVTDAALHTRLRQLAEEAGLPLRDQPLSLNLQGRCEHDCAPVR